jgi:hypothetical protein
MKVVTYVLLSFLLVVGGALWLANEHLYELLAIGFYIFGVQ